MAARRTLSRMRPRLEIGRALSRVLCAAFALVGAFPLLLGFLVRAAPVRKWAAHESEGLITRLAGLDAAYGVHVQLLPLRLVLDHVVVNASDGKAPAFSARRISVTPRLFSLLAGRLDAGDVEIDEPHARLVLEDGKLSNVRFRLPVERGPAPAFVRAPFASLSLTDATVVLDTKGLHVDTGPIGPGRLRRRGAVVRGGAPRR